MTASNSMKKPAPATNHHTMVYLSGIAIVLGVVGGFVALWLTRLIGILTNLCFYHRYSMDFTSPAGNRLGLLVILVPVLGGVIVGLMSRYGSRAIRGHGIPEAMEQILENSSRIPARIILLKPLSAAVSIGSGGPFGAEGPIIATGGAIGSMFGQVLSTTAAERKTLLAAGAAAGMAGIFGSPISAVLLVVELLLFEYRARSIVPVALATATAAGIRASYQGGAPFFSMPAIAPVSMGALVLYGVIGIAMGVVSVGVTRAVYWMEDLFELLPVHWMWWPALGGLAVGGIGYFAPRTFGVGYDNINDILSNDLPLRTIAFLCVMKWISWTIALGSGTSGGTLAPLMTIGSGAGNVAGAALVALFPGCGLDVRVAALVGMAAVFAGASRALLASVVFAFETTLQPAGLLPLLAGSTIAFLTARLFMQNSIMTEKIARRGLRIPEDYDADVFAQVTVGEVMAKETGTLFAGEMVGCVADRIAVHDPVISSFQAWPLVDADGHLAGILTRQDLLRALEQPEGRELSLKEAGSTALVVAYPDETMHDAVARMLTHGIGRLVVVTRDDPRKLAGYLSRTSLLATRLRAWDHETKREPGWLQAARENKNHAI